MKGIGKMTKLMDTAHFIILMVLNIKENGLMIIKMVKGRKHGQMEQPLKEIIKMD